MMHISIRSRYRLLFICTALLIIRFLLPHGRDNSIEGDIAESINSILRLSARICKNGPNEVQKPMSTLKDESRYSAHADTLPPAPLSQLDGGSKKNTKPKPDHSLGNEQDQELLIKVVESDLQWGGTTLQKPPLKPPQEKKPPIADPFPLLSKPLSPFYKNLLSERTRPPTPHPTHETPLFIGFTRNWPQLIQCVVSYIAAGWPAPDIYVVENTGVMYSNRDDKLTLQNPFYLNYTQLSMLGGVKVIMTPTLLTFAQLQNFYAYTALQRNWTEYFWSHQDVVVFSFEEASEGGTPSPDTIAKQGFNIYDRNSSTSLYHRAVSVQSYLRKKLIHTNNMQAKKPPTKWANVFFSYDQLTLVNTASVVDASGWDTHIPFYTSDCDMYIRQKWSNYAHYTTTEAGHVFDVASVLDDVGALLRLPGIHASFPGDPGVPIEEQGCDDPEDDEFPSSINKASTFLREINTLTRLSKQTSRFGETYNNLLATIRRMSAQKYSGGTNSHRNTWQKSQSGGYGEPFYRDAEGFEQGILMQIDLGRSVFSDKWGHRGCDIARNIKSLGDLAWRVERDWDVEEEGWGHEGGW
ncbi:hypothetical protein V8F06_005370 [Rhypophila decipiens]